MPDQRLSDPPATNRQLRFWLIGLGLFVLALWLLSGMLLPFVVGLAVAYLLDPVVDRLERWRLPRWLATTLVLLSFVVVLVLLSLLLLPLVQAQVAHLIEVLPNYATAMKERVLPMIDRLVHRLSPEDVERLRGAAGNYAGEMVGWVGRVLSGILSGGLALFDVLSVLFITPIVAFYLMRDWDLLVAKVNSWLPLDHAETIREQARQVDMTLAGFVRGQALVCLVLGLFYAVGLSVAGLDFGLVIGLLAGLLSFIPYVGTLFGFVSSTGLALLQFDELWRVGVVVGIFLFGQAVEGNVLTPKLVGDKVGLHAVWVIFALLAGGTLFGFVGVLLAVPVAAVIGVLTRFALGRYLQSPYYRGGAAP
ncbi:AI-2E family transporter [Azospirillum rugosum]|uniref:PurR-regulated permease PerM n=1 Tax=Azospirillum rugosum TaxID=416170 RepID=A0ABS4SR29_9PROT|nr:AI-2E family transporter [Azospirillum rugosum]MBP2294412.1 putative PurR-regulated permease PerM [Azospirillum rugosum]MDQ0528917.1 putative PurR-regulated permease PerM [Azospirillum rugosum]